MSNRAPRHKNHLQGICLIMGLLISLLNVSRAYANNYTWTGGAGAPFNWGNLNNWFDNTTSTVDGFPNATTDNATITGGAGTPTLNLSVNVGTLTVTNKSLTGANTLNVFTSASITGTGTFGATTILAMRAASSLTSSPLTYTLGRLQVNATGTVTLGSDVVVAGDVSILAGTLDVTASNRQISVGATTGTSWNRSGGTFTPRNGTVVFTGTGTIQNAETFWNLTVNSGGTVTLAQTMPASVTVSNNLTLSAGTLSTGALTDTTSPPTPVLVVSGNVLVNGGTLDMSGAPNPGGANPLMIVDVYGSLSGTAGGAINAGNLAGTTGFGALRFRSAGAATVDFSNISYSPGNTRLWFCGTTTFTSNAQSIASIRLGSSDLTVGGTLTLADNLTILGNDWTGGGALTIAPVGSSVLTVSNRTVTIGTGSTANVVFNANLTSFVSTGSTFVFNGTSSLTSAGNVFNNITIGASTAALTLLGGGLTLNGNWDNTAGGTFTPSGFTVTFASAAAPSTIFGSTVFAGLACTTPGKSLIFTNGTTQQVTGAFQMNGGAGNQVRLTSDVSGAKWFLIVGGTTNALAVAVRDSTATGTATPIIATDVNSTDLGNNNTPAGWTFPGGATITWGGGTSSDWNLGSNWSPARVPGIADTATISSASPNSPTLTSNVSIAALNLSTVTLNLASFNLVVTNALTETSGTIQLQGGQTVTTGSRTLSGTVEYNGTGTYTGLALGASYTNLRFTQVTTAGTWTLNAPVTVTGTLTYTGSPTVKLSGNNLSVGGVMTVTGTLDASGGGNVTASANVNFTGGAFTSGAGSFIFSGTTTLTSAGKSFSNIQIGAGTGGSLTLADTLTASGTITVAAGGTNVFTVTGQTVNAASTVNLTNLTTFNSGTSTFVFNGTTTLTSAGKSFNNIQIGAGTGGSLTLADTLTVGGTITVAAGGTNVFTVTGQTVNAASTVNLTNLTTFTSGTSTFVFDGTTSLTSAGSIFNNVQIGTATLGGSLTLLDALTLTGTLTFQTAGTRTLNATNQTVTLPTSLDMTNLTTFTSTGSTFVFDGTATLTSATKTFNNLQIGTASTPGLLTLADNLTLTGAITVGAAAGSTFTVTNRTVTVAGNVTYSASLATFTSGGSTFVFDGTTSLTSAGKSFNNIQIGAGSGGSLTLADNLTLTGNISVVTGGTTTFTVTGLTVTVGGNVTFTGLTTLNAGTSTFVFDGSGTLTSAGFTLVNLVIGTATIPGALTLGDNLTLTGTITVGAAAGSSFVVTNRTVTVAGNVTLTNLAPANFTSTGSTFIFDGTTSLTSAGGTFNNVQIGTATLGGSLTLLDALTLTGTLTFQTAGTRTLNATSQTVTLPTSLDMTNLTTFTSTGSTFVFDGTATLTSATKTFNNLQIGTASTPGLLTLADNLTLTGAITVGAAAGSTFTVTNRTVTVAGNVTYSASLATFTGTGSTFIFDGTTTLTSAGKSFSNIQIGAGSGGSLTLADTLTVGGTITVAAGGTNVFTVTGQTVNAASTVNLTNLTTFTSGTSTFVFDGTTSLTSAGKSFNNIQIGGGSGGSLTLADNLTLTGNISVVTGGTTTFTVTGLTVTVGGNVTFTGLTTLNAGTSTFVFDGSGTLTSAGFTLVNLVIGTATIPGALTLGDNLTLTGTITVGAAAGSTFTVTNRTVTVAGNVTYSASLATFTSGGSTFVFDGTTSLTSAGKSFNNIQIGAGSGGSLTLADNLTLTGNISVVTGGITTFTVTGLTVTVGGNVTFTGLTTLNAGTSTFVFDGSGTLTSAGFTLVNLVIGTATIPGALTLGDNLTLTGTITVGAAAGSSFVVTNRTVTVAGNVTLTNLAPANFTSTGSTFIFDGTTSLTSAGGTFNNVQIGTATLGGSLTLLDALTLTGTLTFQTAGTRTLNATSQTVTLPTSLDMTNLTTFTSTGSTFVFDGTATLTSATKTFNNLQIGTASTPGLLTLADNLTLTGAITVGAAAGSTFTVTNRTVTVAGNVTYSASLATFTGTGSTFIFDGTTTLTSATKTFNNVQVGTAATAASATLADNLTLINASGVLSMTRGTLDLNGHTAVLGTALNMSSANVAQITIGTGTLDGTTNGRAVTISSAQATITQSTGTMQTPSLTVSAGAYTITGIATVTLGTGGLSQTGGTISAGGALIRSSGNVSILAAGVFTPGTSTVTMDTTGTSVQVVTPNSLNNLTIGVAATGTVTISTNDLTLQGTLDVIAGWTFTTASLNLTVNSITISGAVVVSTTEKITVSANWNRTGTFTHANGTVQFSGTGSIAATGGETFWNLVKSGAATTTTYNSDLVVIGNITLSSGTLADGGTHKLTVGVQGTSPASITWDSTGGGTFSGGTGSVHFDNTAIVINGPNTFYNFVCDVVADSLASPVTISFQAAITQIVTHDFFINGTAAVGVTLQSAAGVFTPPPPDDPSLTQIALPTAPPPHWAQQLYISLSGTATINYVAIQLSWASTASVTPGPTCTNKGYNDNWLFVIPIIASWALDTNNNGRIDRIRVQVAFGTTLSNNFGELVARVSGYTVTGFAAVNGNTDVFDILLQEGPPGPAEDTSATPTWQLLQNPSSPLPGLFGTVGGAYVESGTKTYVASDGARPVINYTLAALGSREAYVRFSEPVTADAGFSVPIGIGSLTYSDAGNPITAVTPVERSGAAAHAAIVTFANPLTANDIFLGPVRTLQAPSGAIWGAAAATDPTGPSYANAVSDNNLTANASRFMLDPGTTPVGPAHNVSDFGVGFVTPVLALDRDVTRDPARGGLGMVTVFDGSKWLPPHNIFLEARIMVPSMSANALTLSWDVNPPASMALNNLWIPPTASTVWPGNAGGDRAHSPGDSQARTPLSATATNGALRDFIIPNTDPALKDGAMFQFLFLLNDGAGNLLPCAFPADPANPASVRPFEYMIHSIIEQRGGVSVTNNVINPGLGQVAYVHYTITAPGQVTITVFDLSGSIVNVLQRGSQASGEYTTAWDGRNRGGRAVARGIYFIRVVGPGFDEIRKVLVVR